MSTLQLAIPPSMIHLLLDEAHLPTSDLACAPGLRCWVFDAGGELVGVIGLQRAQSGALVRSHAVAAAYRGQGHSVRPPRPA